jgi:hypothetical protein
MDPPRVPVAVCESEGWFGFMVEVLYPSAHRVQLAPGDGVSRLLSRIPPSTRAVLFNVNLSHTTDFVEADAAWPIPALNATATDVRKRTIHTRAAALGLPTARATESGPPDERVIVKTTLNYAGKPERLMRERWGDRAARYTMDLGDTTEYVICRRDHVSAATWADPSLVVERYITNPDGLFIRAYVVGPAAVVTLAWAAGDIKKLSLPQSDRRSRARHRPPLGIGPRRRFLRRRLHGRCGRHDHPGRCQQDALLGPPSPVPRPGPPPPRVQRADRRFHLTLARSQ